jgi:hypothetical protein
MGTLTNNRKGRSINDMDSEKRRQRTHRRKVGAIRSHMKEPRIHGQVPEVEVGDGPSVEGRESATEPVGAVSHRTYSSCRCRGHMEMK